MTIKSTIQSRLREWNIQSSKLFARLKSLGLVRQNHKEWEKTFDAIDEWICIIDLNATILRSNRTIEKYLNLDVRDAIGVQCCELAHGSKIPLTGCPLPKMLKSGKRESVEVRTQDDRWLLISVDPIFDRKGNISRVVHIARDITHRKLIENERKQLVKELKQALGQIKTLHGLIPICSHCKKIRDDKGYWNLLESYIETHSQASFSHGMCPECSEELYGQEDWYMDMKKEKKGRESD